MSTDDLIRKLKPVMERWPCGMLVWHRADARRGIITEHSISGQGSVGICVSFDPMGSDRQCQAAELSAVKLNLDDDEAWKDGDQQGGTAEL